MAILRLTNGDAAGAAYQVGSTSQRIGRREGNDLCLQDISISGTHCEISLDASGNLFVRDLGSTNGTFIEGEKIQEALVQPGQRLRLGTLEMIFESEAALPSPAPSHSAPKPMPVRLSVSAPPVPGAPVAVALAGGPPPFAQAVAAGPDDCANHPGIPAIVVCGRCGRKACADCTKQQTAGMSIVDFCLACGGQCKTMAQIAKENATLAARNMSFGQAIARSFKYPFKGNGLILLIVGTIFYAIMDALLGGRALFLGFYKLLLFVIIYGYLFAYMQKIVVCSAAGDEDPPEWPEVSDIQSDIVRPFLQLLVTLLVAFAPSWFVSVKMGPLPGQFVSLVGDVYFPMALLAVAMSDSYTGLNPIFVLSSIMKVPGPYVITCILFAGLSVMWTHVRHIIYAIPAPIVPQLIYWFVFLILLMISMRILGMLYFLNRNRLGWGL